MIMVGRCTLIMLHDDVAWHHKIQKVDNAGERLRSSSHTTTPQQKLP